MDFNSVCNDDVNIIDDLLSVDSLVKLPIALLNAYYMTRIQMQKAKNEKKKPKIKPSEFSFWNLHPVVK